jgi:hypothetical protein
MGICCASIKKTPSYIYSPDIDQCELESQDTNSDETELQVNVSYSPDIDPKKRESKDRDSKVTDSPGKDPIWTESHDADSDEIESRESPDLDPEDKQIYEGNFENVPTITQSEIRIFLSSTFKGKIIYNI